MSVSGVYGDGSEPLPMMELSDRGLQLRMASATCGGGPMTCSPCCSCPEDELGVETLTTHRARLEQAPEHNRTFQGKSDGCGA